MFDNLVEFLRELKKRRGSRNRLCENHRDLDVHFAERIAEDKEIEAGNSNPTQSKQRNAALARLAQREADRAKNQIEWVQDESVFSHYDEALCDAVEWCADQTDFDHDFVREAVDNLLHASRMEPSKCSECRRLVDALMELPREKWRAEPWVRCFLPPPMPVSDSDADAGVVVSPEQTSAASATSIQPSPDGKTDERDDQHVPRLVEILWLLGSQERNNAEHLGDTEGQIELKKGSWPETRELEDLKERLERGLRGSTQLLDECVDWVCGRTALSSQQILNVAYEENDFFDPFKARYRAFSELDERGETAELWRDLMSNDRGRCLSILGSLERLSKANFIAVEPPNWRARPAKVVAVGADETARGIRTPATDSAPMVPARKPSRMDLVVADKIARKLNKADPQFKHGDVESWARGIREYQSETTGTPWSCSTSTVHKTGFWDEIMTELGRSRKKRSVKTVAFTGKAEATVASADTELNDLVAREEERAIDVVMKSRMSEQEMAATIENIRDGSTTPAQAIELASVVPQGRKPKKAAIRE